MITFNELGLVEPLLDAIQVRGFETPTPIQEKMIPFLLTEDRDVIGLAQTGTGKTAAFGLPILQDIVPKVNHTQALILTPTRELGIQVSREISHYGQNIKGLKTTTVYGGAPFSPQIRKLRAGSHIVTATPGRLKDLLDRGIADLSHLRYLVLDEADQMLDMGFKDDLDAILSSACPARRTLLFSATMPAEVAKIASNYMIDPHEIVSGERNRGTANVSHYAYRIRSEDKYAALRRLMDMSSDIYAIIFCRTRDITRDLASRLSSDGYAADSLHGELSQIQREQVMRRFRQGNPALLVATDVAARGLDVENLTHVIHYDLPDEIAIYTHRSGRTGRAGNEGISLALIHAREEYKLRRIEKVLGRKIELKKIPNGDELCQNRLTEILNRVLQVEVNDEAMQHYINMAQHKLEALDRDALIRRFISVEFNRFLKDYGNASDLNPPPPPKRSRRDAEHIAVNSDHRRGKRPSKPMVSLRLNLGRKQGLLPPQIIGLINQVTRSRDIVLGRIDINASWSDVQVEGGMADRVEHSLRGYTYKGMKVRVERRMSGSSLRKRHSKDRKNSRKRHSKR